jgi:hypothetical protein
MSSSVLSISNPDYRIDPLVTAAGSIAARQRVPVPVNVPTTYSSVGSAYPSTLQFDIYDPERMLYTPSLEVAFWFKPDFRKVARRNVSESDPWYYQPWFAPAVDGGLHALFNRVKIGNAQGLIIEEILKYNLYTNVMNLYGQSHSAKHAKVTGAFSAQHNSFVGYHEIFRRGGLDVTGTMITPEQYPAAYIPVLDANTGMFRYKRDLQAPFKASNPIATGTYSGALDVSDKLYDRELIVPLSQSSFLNKTLYIPLMLLRNGLRIEIDLASPYEAFVQNSLGLPGELPHRVWFRNPMANYALGTQGSGASASYSGTAPPSGVYQTSSASVAAPVYNVPIPKKVLILSLGGNPANAAVTRSDANRFETGQFGLSAVLSAAAQQPGGFPSNATFPNTVVRIPETPYFIWCLSEQRGRGRVVSFKPGDKFTFYKQDPTARAGMVVLLKGEVTAIAASRNTRQQNPGTVNATCISEIKHGFANDTVSNVPFLNYTATLNQTGAGGASAAVGTGFAAMTNVDEQVVYYSSSVIQYSAGDTNATYFARYGIDQTKLGPDQDLRLDEFDWLCLESAELDPFDAYDSLLSSPITPPGSSRNPYGTPGWAYTLTKATMLCDYSKPASRVVLEYVNAFKQPQGIAFGFTRMMYYSTTILGDSPTAQLNIPFACRSLRNLVICFSDELSSNANNNIDGTVCQFPCLSSFMSRGINNIEITVGAQKFPNYRIDYPFDYMNSGNNEIQNVFSTITNRQANVSFPHYRLNRSVRRYNYAGGFDNTVNSFTAGTELTPSRGPTSHSTEYIDTSAAIFVATFEKRNGDFLCGVDVSAPTPIVVRAEFSPQLKRSRQIHIFGHCDAVFTLQTDNGVVRA